MGAVKEALDDSLSSVLETYVVEMNSDRVVMNCEFMNTFLALTDGDNQMLQAQEQQWFEEYHIDTADFLADWTHAITAAVAIFTGLATTEDGLIGNSFSWLAYRYHIAPRGVVVAMQKCGLTDRAIQGIIYMLAGVILDENDKMKIVKFSYLDK